MAGMEFNIQDKASVQAWMDRAEKLNERAAQVVRGAGQVLEEFKLTAEGQIFDQVVNYSSSVIEGANKILEGMNEILEVVNNLVQTVIAKIAELASGVETTQRNVIG